MTPASKRSPVLCPVCKRSIYDHATDCALTKPCQETCG